MVSSISVFGLFLVLWTGPLNTKYIKFLLILEDWRLENTNGRNILFYKGKNYTPKDTELRWDIVKTFHDHQTARHPGEIGTYNAV